MSAIIYDFRYHGDKSTVPESNFSGKAVKKKETVNDDDIVNYLLTVIERLEQEDVKKRSHSKWISELLAFKYGVQNISELDEEALEEFKSDIEGIKLNPNQNRSPSGRFREMLAYKYGVQSVYELDREDLEELLDDVRLIEEDYMMPHPITKRKTKILKFNKATSGLEEM